MDRIDELRRRYGHARLSLFGIILPSDSHAGSDLDIIVESAARIRIGPIGVAKLESECSAAIKRRVDLRSAAELSRHFRDEVMAGARLLHPA